ncbi:MAG: NADH-quinone oxidoreductase subunit N [Opitutales bacterium]|nr:NADH-quinone oxidoreductase subunit N [Opitutales bacterium]
MDAEALQSIVATNQWGAIWPEILLGCLAVVLLFVDLFTKSRGVITVRIAIWSQVLLLVFLLGRFVFGSASGELGSHYFSGMILQTASTEWARLFFLFASICVCHIGGVYLASRKLAKVEFYHIVMIITAGLMLLAQANDFLLFFVVLETVTIGFYILVAYARHSRFSLEAGLKYLVMAAFSSAIMLFGIVLLYGVAGNPNLPMTASMPLNFDQLAAFIAADDGSIANRGNLMVTVGAALVLIGIAFKIGAVPFQIWVPDVYQGAPTPVTAFLAVASKAAGFIVLFLLLRGPFADLDFLWVPLLTVIAVLTLLFGNIAALGQRNVKRIMGMSGVAHAGVLLLGVLAAQQVDWAYKAVWFYLFVYALASFAVFTVMAHVAPQEDSDQSLERYDNLIRRQPLLGTILIIGLGSLAGIPPLAGFVAKLLIFVAAFQAELYTLLGVALLGVVLSIYYYFAWIRAAVMKHPFVEDSETAEIPSPTFGSKVFMITLAAATIVLGVYQGMFAIGG